MNVPQHHPSESLVEATSDFDLSRLIDVARRRWKIAVMAVLLLLPFGLVHYLITPKAYRGTAKIQIERRSVVTAASGQAWLENWFNLEFYPTQYRLLESRGLAEKVVEDLRLHEDPTFNPDWARFQPEASEKVALADLDDAYKGRLGLRLLGGLTISPIEKTQLVSISFISTNPTLAAKIANGLAESFIEWGLQERSSSASAASSFLLRQIESLKAEIQDKENELQQYSRSTDIVGIEGSANPVMQRFDALNEDYSRSVSARIEKEASYHEILASPKETVADTLSGGLISELKKDQLNLEKEYATKSKTFKPEWPEMVNLKASIDSSRAHIQRIVAEQAQEARKLARAEYQTALRQEGRLKEELDLVKEEAMSFNSAAVQFKSLEVEVSTRRALLDTLLRRQSDTQVAASLRGSSDSNIRIIERALVPGGAFRPNLKRDLLQSGGLGLLLGIGLIFLVEFLDRSVKEPDEVEKLLGIPVLTVVPDTQAQGQQGYGYGYGYGIRRKKSKLSRRGAKERKTSIELLPHDKPRHAVSEAYRALRTALMLSSAEELHTLAVTSAQSGEGKTTTITNLATVLAQLDHRVIIVDADLRKPRIHKVFKLKNRIGLVHWLTGQSPLDDLVQKTRVPGLFVMTSGAIPPNPSELLSSKKMGDLITKLREQFDYVLFDTPPVLAVTDASLVGKRADGLLMTLQAGKIHRDEAKAATDRLQMGGIRVLGVILNRFIPRRGSSGGGYRYYYAYQQYGQGEESESGTAA